MPARLTLLLTSPRVPAGLLTRDAWDALAHAGHRLAADTSDPLPLALAESGMPVTALALSSAPELARELVDRAVGQGDATEDASAAGTEVVWVGSPDGDPGLTDAVASEVTRRQEPPEVEVLVGSWDVPGARLLDLVAVMDRLRSPGGCPWDAEQTHESLVPYLIEEAHEAVEAIESGDRDHMVEELGDLLLQVAFQSRVGEEDPHAPFDIDDVAAGIVEKLVRRHPHVFADATASSPEEVSANWDQIKAAEKPARTSPLDGIPAGMPPLARAAKVASRLEQAGHADLLEDAVERDDLGGRLLSLVVQARRQGNDASAALRRTLRDIEQLSRHRER